MADDASLGGSKIWDVISLRESCLGAYRNTQRHGTQVGRKRHSISPNELTIMWGSESRYAKTALKTLLHIILELSLRPCALVKRRRKWPIRVAPFGFKVNFIHIACGTSAPISDASIFGKKSCYYEGCIQLPANPSTLYGFCAYISWNILN
jgi:hypothetical protein